MASDLEKLDELQKKLDEYEQTNKAVISQRGHAMARQLRNPLIGGVAPEQAATPSQALEFGARFAYPTLGAIGGLVVGGPAGGIVGAGLGGAAAELQFNPSPTAASVAVAGGIEGATEVAGGLVPRLGRMAVRGMTGVPSEGRELARVARDQFGINLGPMQVGQGRLPGFFSQVFSKIPFFGGPIRKQMQKTYGEVVEAGENLVLAFGPHMTDLAEIGVRLDAKGKEAFERFFGKDIGFFPRRYAEARNLARARNATVDSAPIKEEFSRILQKIEESKLPGSKTHPVERFVKRHEDLPDKLTMDQLDGPAGLEADLNKAMKQAGKAGFDLRMYMDIKNAAAKSLRETVSDPEVAGLLQRADADFERVKRTIFETPTAQKIGRVTKNAFEFGIERQGTINPDELASVIFQGPGKGQALAGSPQRVEQAYRLFGRDATNEVVAYQFRKAFVDSRIVGAQDPLGRTVFDMEVLRNRLGLDDVTSGRYQAMKRALELSQTGVTISKLDDFVNVVETAFRNAPDDVNTFLARRMVLGGGRSLVRAFLVFGGKGPGSSGMHKSIAGALTLTLISRKFGRILSDPAMMDLAKTALSERVREGVRWGAALRLARLTGEIAIPDAREALTSEVQSLVGEIGQVYGAPGESK